MFQEHNDAVLKIFLIFQFSKEFILQKKNDFGVFPTLKIVFLGNTNLKLPFFALAVQLYQRWRA